MSAEIPLKYTSKSLTPFFGAIIEGINLASEIDHQTVEKIKADLNKHRLLLFRSQGRLSAETQLKVSNWFGRVESTFAKFIKHPKSPHPDIFRVSNDHREGCTNVGRSGFHIDGTFMRCPFKVQTMHFWSASKGGSTFFTPLNELIQHLSKEESELYHDLYFMSDNGLIKPLIYPHPITGKETMVFHCGEPFVRAIVKGYKPDTHDAEKVFNYMETHKFLQDITNKCLDKKIMHELIWEEGDFAIIDNLAVAHYASPNTQGAVEEVGLRILHRTTIAGEHEPKKGV